MGKKKNNNNNYHSSGGGGGDGGKVFLLDIRNNPQQQQATLNINNNSTSFHSQLQLLSETAVHRKIIDLFKRRDDFQQVDLNIRTSRSLSPTTRIDLTNALMHMRGKGKKLRRLSADIDYMDPSVHEFVLLNCLWFDEVRITSNPEERTYLSSGLAMSLRHALTMNAKCTRVLDLTCGLTEETCEMLGEAMAGAHQLEVLKLHLLAPMSRHLCGVLESLKGKSRLQELHLTDVTADISESLAGLLQESNCRITELDLSFGWELEPHFDTAQFCRALLANVKNNNTKSSVKKLLLDGIRFDSSSSSSTTRVLALAFPNMETLSIAAPKMPRLAFLDLPPHQLPHKLKSCYFPCTELDIEQGRNLVERLPSTTDVPDFSADVVVYHVLEWRKIMERREAPKKPALWPYILARTNSKLHSHDPQRCANMLYTLLQDYHELRRNGELILPGDNITVRKTWLAAVTKPYFKATTTATSSRNSNSKKSSKKEKPKAVVEEEVDMTADFSIFDTFNDADGDY